MHVFYCCDGGLFIDLSFESRLSEVSRRYCFVSSISAWRNINSAAAAKLNDLSAETDWFLLFFLLLLLPRSLPKGSALDTIPQFWEVFIFCFCFFIRERLQFHFYLSIMHEVVEIRPRARTPLAEGLSLIPPRTQDSLAPLCRRAKAVSCLPPLTFVLF